MRRGGGGRAARARRKAKREEAQRSWEVTKAWKQLTNVEYLKEVRKLILDSGVIHKSCILSTRILCMLAPKLGTVANPITIETTVSNAILGPLVLKHGWHGISEDDLHAAADQGGRMISLGTRGLPDDPGHWHGHLGAVIHGPNGMRGLVDLSIDQGHRPDRGIVLVEPLVIEELPAEWFTGEVQACYQRRDKSVVTVSAWPEDRTFERTTDWNRDDYPILELLKL